MHLTVRQDEPVHAGETDAEAAALRACAAAFVAAAQASLPAWLERIVELRLAAAGVDTAAEPTRVLVGGAVARATDAVVTDLTALVETDVDAQSATPLQVLRDALGAVTEALATAGVQPIERDAWEARMHPEDVYGLAPAVLADVDERLHEAGLVWGAAKAHVVLARRRADGTR